MITIEMLRIANAPEQDTYDCYVSRTPGAPIQNWCWPKESSATMFPLLVAGIGTGAMFCGDGARIAIGPFAIVASKDGIFLNNGTEQIPFATWGGLWEYMDSVAPLVHYETPT